ncbi:MAG: hypothetical protein IJ637_08855 [Prevotella sp.]|nr:hypothetical protein [Prevotella sp.]
MKKIIISILTLATVLCATAQTMTTKAIVVYQKDGQRDTLMWKQAWAELMRSYIYGIENPADDDYITLTNTRLNSAAVEYRLNLTYDGRHAPYDEYSVVLSPDHITEAPAIACPSDNGIQNLYFADNQQWYYISYNRIYGSNTVNYYFRDNFLLVPGRTYYLRGYYKLDGKVHFSSEVALTAPKSIIDVIDFYYSNYTKAGSYIVYDQVDASYCSQHTELFGEWKDDYLGLIKNYVSRVLEFTSDTELAAMATKTEHCDDGTLYVIDSVPASVIEEAMQLIATEAKQQKYVQANLDNIFTGQSNTNYFGTYYCNPTIIQADEQWGIRDNQYLVTKPSVTTAKPRIAFTWNQLMLPGVTYDVELTLAPNTEDETDSLNVMFMVHIGSQKANGTVPTISETPAYGTDTVSGKMNYYVAKPQELRVIKMQYKPANPALEHYLQLGDNPFSFFSAANRARYGREFRVVGFELKPHEEE